jgi:hypothetical protein
MDEGNSATNLLIGLGLAFVGYLLAQKYDLPGFVEEAYYAQASTPEKARTDLLHLSALYFRGLLEGNQALMNKAHADAEVLRQRFPGAGPEGGYSPEDLQKAGLLTPDQVAAINRILGGGT